MWTCPKCKQKFIRKSQTHSCNEKTVEDFLKGKSAHTIELYQHFISEYKKIANIKVHPARSQIGIAAKKRFAFIPRLGKNFVDVGFAFDRAYEDNLCFYRIGKVPESTTHVHYIRIMNKEDINDEVRKFMKLAFDLGNKSSEK